MYLFHLIPLLLSPPSSLFPLISFPTHPSCLSSVFIVISCTLSLLCLLPSWISPKSFSPSFLSHHPSFSFLFPLIPLSNYPSPQHFSLSFPSPVLFISPLIPFLSYPSLLLFLSLPSLFSHSSLISAVVAYVLVVSSCYFCWYPC
jgi:hypothetical protein